MASVNALLRVSQDLNEGVSQAVSYLDRGSSTKLIRVCRIQMLRL